jgi:predicted GNAT family acetyltransferase
MAEIKIQLNNNDGSFHLVENEEQLGELTFSIEGKDITAHHTEVAEQHQGKGAAKQLFDAVVQYARDNQLQIVPMCSYVQTSFQRKPHEYADVWKK